MGVRHISDNAMGHDLIEDLLQEIVQLWIVDDCNLGQLATLTPLSFLFHELYSGLGDHEAGLDQVVAKVFLALGFGLLRPSAAILASSTAFFLVASSAFVLTSSTKFSPHPHRHAFSPHRYLNLML